MAMEQEEVPAGEEVFIDESDEVYEEEATFEVEEEGATGETVQELGLNEGTLKASSVDEINVSSFETLTLDAELAAAALDVWQKFVALSGSREAAGLAVYTAFYDAAPSLQSIFVTPKAVMAMRMFETINTFLTTLGMPEALKTKVETLSFGHFVIDVTVPRVVIIRDALIDMMTVELGDKFTRPAQKGFHLLLNYVGGAMIFIKAHYSERLRVLSESWSLANDKAANDDKFASMGSKEINSHGPGANEKDEESAKAGEAEHGKKEAANSAQNVPTTYSEMFLFNAAVMGFGNALWMNEVLAQFDNIVKNASNPSRFGEECEILVLRISRVAAKNQVNLADYKSCMLASLRSLLPKEWSTSHENAWSWLWESVERKLLSVMGNPPIWEKTLAKFIESLDETQAFEFRSAVYAKFFSICPVGQDFFKQSTTYLHLMAIKITGMTIDMYREPVRMVDEISALGLRHVGYGIPTEHFAPWVTSWIEVLQTVTQDETLIESLRWSISLITKSLVRNIQEGSTIVMKAINVNTKNTLKNAVSCASRGERAGWCLMVQVGTQNISPLAWAVQSGALESASAIIDDLLTIRADREKYYYGAEELFVRHPDIVKKLCDDAPTLLPQLLDGIIWRSRSTFNGMRRVNYYVKHMLVGPEGKFHQPLEWVAKLKDPKVVCHPVLVLVADTTWSRIASSAFLFKQSWFLWTMLVFVFSQAILEKTHFLTAHTEHIVVFVCRCFIYLCTLGHGFFMQLAMIIKAYRHGHTVRLFGKILIPQYWQNWQDCARMFLLALLIIMLATEPILGCMGTKYAEDDMFTQECPEAADLRKFPYTTCSMLVIYVYFTLLIDLAVFNTRFSAYVLACARMLAEVALFLLAVVVCLVTFSCGFSCVHQELADFHGINVGALALWELLIGGYMDDKMEMLHDEYIILFGCYTFLVFVAVFLLNMLVAQLSCSYGSTYADMVGFARLKRINLIVETMATVSEKRWNKFLAGMAFEKKLEFNEGDVGLAGGVATSEGASLHPTTVDMIQRFGGSTSPDLQWPITAGATEEEADKVDRLEKLIAKIAAAQASAGSSAKKRGGGGQSSAGGSAQEDATGGSGVEVEAEADE